MKRLVGEICAECVKMRHTFLYPVHVVIPVLGSMLCLFYYRFSGWSEQEQISGFMEIIGVSLPFVISVVCSGNMALEEQSHFQILLGSFRYKWRGFRIKWVVLAGMGYVAIFWAVAVFGAGYHWWLGKSGVSAKMYLYLINVLFLGSIWLYLEHLFWNLVFPRTVSLCVGVIEFLVSALFLTGLGDGRWQYFPCTWSARGVLLLLNGGMLGENVLRPEMTKIAFFCPLLLGGLCAIIGIGLYIYEGRKCND